VSLTASAHNTWKFGGRDAFVAWSRRNRKANNKIEAQ